MFKFFNSVFGKFLRWILVFPTSLAIMLLVGLILPSLRDVEGAWSKSNITLIPTIFITSLFQFYTGIIVVYYISPCFKKNMAITFAIILVFFSLGLIVLSPAPILFLASNAYDTCFLGILAGYIGVAIAIFELKGK